MRLFILVLAALLTAGSVVANTLIRSDDEIRLPLADGWVVGGDDSGFPIQLYNEDLSAELQIYRSEIAADEAIADSEELRHAVQEIIADVILSLPDAELLTNTGYHDRRRVRFVLEFVSYDTASLTEINHRLVGILYRHPDGHQLLFTLWGKTPNPPPPNVLADLESMQEHFEYFGPAMNEVFPAKADYRFFLLGGSIILLLLILRFWKRSRRADETNSVVEQPSANQ